MMNIEEEIEKACGTLINSKLKSKLLSIGEKADKKIAELENRKLYSVSNKTSLVCFWNEKAAKKYVAYYGGASGLKVNELEVFV